MRRTRRSRATGREQVVDDLFSTRGLEADPIPEGADQQFSLRPFAAAVPQDDLVNTEPESNEPTTDRLYRRAADAASKGRVPRRSSATGKSCRWSRSILPRVTISLSCWSRLETPTRRSSS
jgi:hypothetical protein